MRFGSICSGIEAASVAWLPLGWRCQFMSEIEAFPRAVLRHHYGDTPLHGDFTTIRAGEYGPIDLLVGGTPCQSFSIAGLRRGLADERGNLALEYLRLADRLRPRWLVWENVPGVLSSGAGRDFGAFLGGLAELGYGFAYRVLDAQFFGLAQRRKRVFVVGYLGDWRRAAAVLFEPASLRGNPAPSRETGEGAAPTLAARTKGGGGLGIDFDCDGGLIANTLRVPSHGATWRGDGCDNFVSHTLNAKGGAGRIDAESETFVAQQLYSIMPQNSGKDYKARAVDVAQPVMAGGPVGDNQGGDVVITHALRADGFDASEDGTGRGTPIVTTLAIRGRGDSHDLEWREDGTANAVLTPNGGRGGIGVGAIAFQANASFASGTGDDVSPSIRAQSSGGSGMPGVATHTAVRRLTPRECCRLQGFPDDYLDIVFNGRPAADGPKYRALGNSMAVPVMRWIGQRIASVDRSVAVEAA